MNTWRAFFTSSSGLAPARQELALLAVVVVVPWSNSAEAIKWDFDGETTQGWTTKEALTWGGTREFHQFPGMVEDGVWRIRGVLTDLDGDGDLDLFGLWETQTEIPQGRESKAGWLMAVNDGRGALERGPVIEEVAATGMESPVPKRGYSMRSYADFWAGIAKQERDSAAMKNQVGSPFLVGAEEPLVYNLGVNIVVYALTREGSLARQFVDAD